MIAPSDILGADETLKALFARFRAAPESQAFEELAEALLARGHANEALQITEHGLQKLPLHVGGRIQRAAALIALGRPKVAYVELLRVLAIQSDNARAQRLLGRVFVEAGAPDRAAKLLAKRHQAASLARKQDAPPPSVEAHVEAAPLQEDEMEDTRRIDIPEELAAKVLSPMIPRASEAPTIAPRLSAPNAPTDVANLFAELTKDLGLKPERSVSTKVEVTQVIRLKQQPKPRPHLSTIDGPIVDTTHPGDLDLDLVGDLEPVDTTKTPASLFDVVTSPHGLGGMSLTDEPLFQEDLPFRVDAVAEGLEQGGETAPKELDFDVLRRSMTKELPRLGEADDDERGVLGSADLPLPPKSPSSPPLSQSEPKAARPAAAPRVLIEDDDSPMSRPTKALVVLLVLTAACIVAVLLLLR